MIIMFVRYFVIKNNWLGVLYVAGVRGGFRVVGILSDIGLHIKLGSF